MMSGQTSRHEYLESQLAEFVGKPDAFLLNFGYQGMVSIIDAMTSRHDCIVYDAEDHACIMDGLRLSPAKDMCTRILTWKACVNNWKEQPNGWKTPVVVF